MMTVKHIFLCVLMHMVVGAPTQFNKLCFLKKKVICWNIANALQLVFLFCVETSKQRQWSFNRHFEQCEFRDTNLCLFQILMLFCICVTFGHQHAKHQFLAYSCICRAHTLEEAHHKCNGTKMHLELLRDNWIFDTLIYQILLMMQLMWIILKLFNL